MTPDTTDTTTRVMIDIETLGIEPGAAILSIGACTFDTDGVREILTGGVPLATALSELRDFLDTNDYDELWANSPKFDMAHLEAAYDAHDPPDFGLSELGNRRADR